jgi:anti-sigma-K factor RskA
MSERDHESRRDEIAAFLIGALDPGEAAELERHLAGCPDCRAELRWLEPAAQLLPESVERVPPPPELRERILAQASSEIPPAPAAAGRERRPLLGGRRPIAGLAALALVVAAIAGYAIGGGSGGGVGTTTMLAGKPPGVMARMTREGDSATLRLANVHQLPDDRVLEAWVQRDGRVVPVRSLFVPDREGRASTTIPDLSGVDVVMVTAEPRGGSQRPTSAPMVTLEMSPS